MTRVASPVSFRFTFCIFVTCISVAQSSLGPHSCGNTGNYTNNSIYENNLNIAVASLYAAANTSNSGFYNASVGENFERVNALVLCRGDVQPESCRRCVSDSINKLRELCPNRKEAVVWYDECVFRYSSHSIFYIVETQPTMYIWNVNNASNMVEFNKDFRDLLDTLKGRATQEKFATRGLNFSTIYGLMQCTAGLSSIQCDDCLHQTVEQLSFSYSGQIRGQILSPSCKLRFEDSRFYNEISFGAPPPPPPPLQNTHRMPKGQKNPFNFIGPPPSLPPQSPPAHPPPPLPPPSPPPPPPDTYRISIGPPPPLPPSSPPPPPPMALRPPPPHRPFRLPSMPPPSPPPSPPPAPLPPPPSGKDLLCSKKNNEYFLGDLNYDLTCKSLYLWAVAGNNNTRQTVIIVIVLVVVAFVILLIVLVCILKRKSKKRTTTTLELKNNDVEDISGGGSLQYDFATIEVATDYFSNSNKLGQGGFGAVYRGTLPNGKKVAVKRLSRASAQGEQEFKNEVMLMAQLQHRNLVRLFGFSYEGTERLLIYEYMPNASLDHFIFNSTRHSYLDWKTRYKIIRGIARGILYLHEDSRLRIIHRDLKASNILLDAEMNPKIADFGIAKLFDLEETQGNTSRIAGTYGYMAPEYAMYGKFSVKSDVFSFGVLVLEIVSGQKNHNFQNRDNIEHLASFAWTNWRGGTASNVIDPILRDNSGSVREMIRCIHIGLLCVQENATDRPTMESVVLMLNSVSLRLAVPSEPAFFMHSRIDLPPTLYGDTSNSEVSGSSSKAKETSIDFTVNEASITDLYPR